MRSPRIWGTEPGVRRTPLSLAFKASPVYALCSCASLVWLQPLAPLSHRAVMAAVVPECPYCFSHCVRACTRAR